MTLIEQSPRNILRIAPVYEAGILLFKQVEDKVIQTVGRGENNIFPSETYTYIAVKQPLNTDNVLAIVRAQGATDIALPEVRFLRVSGFIKFQKEDMPVHLLTTTSTNTDPLAWVYKQWKNVEETRIQLDDPGYVRWITFGDFPILRAEVINKSEVAYTV